MTTTFIYALCEPGTRTVRYIGKTSDMKDRLRRHLSASVKHATHLGCWLRSLVGVPPEMIALREVLGDGVDAEMRYIRLARGCRMDLVNATDGGDGVTMTPEIRGKIGAALKGKAFTPSHLAAVQAAGRRRIGTPPPNKGKPMSEKQREFLRGLVGEKSPHFGRKRPKETGARISKALTGRKASDEARANMSAAKQGPKHNMFGTHCSEETKAKMRVAAILREQRLKGRKDSEETKVRKSIAIKASWAVRKQKGGL